MRLSDLKRSAALLGACFALLIAPGCVQLLPETQPSTIYRLSPSVPETEAQATGAGEVILVERPEAPRGLAGNRIATARGQGQIAYIAQSQWISPAPDMIQEMILDTFDRRLQGYTAARPADGVRARYTVRLELRHFEAVYDQGENRAPNARVVLRARLVDENRRKLLGVTTVDGEARADANRQGAIVDAFSSAARDAANALVDWAGQTLSETGTNGAE